MMHPRINKTDPVFKLAVSVIRLNTTDNSIGLGLYLIDQDRQIIALMCYNWINYRIFRLWHTLISVPH